MASPWQFCSNALAYAVSWLRQHNVHLFWELSSALVFLGLLSYPVKRLATALSSEQQSSAAEMTEDSSYKTSRMVLP